ncbi:MAG: phasin family protein [Rhizobiaceae bacterium]|nr:phasin family protein [Rhizobiaceae bacterium]
MINSFEGASAVLDSGMKSMASLSKGLQTIAEEATEYTRKSFEEGGAAMEKVLGAKSPEKVVEIQVDYAKKAYEGFVAGATRMGELYAEVAKDAYRPFEAAVARTR